MQLLLKKIVPLLFVLLSFWGNSQYPAYFNLSTEDNLPSNEVYSILQDHDGYIWIGCDAGIYRYNGVQFEHFTSEKLSARSATGLCQSKSGRIYAYNFNNQIFYVENNALKVIESWKLPINGLVPDNKGKIWISSSEQPFIVDEKTDRWSVIKSNLHIKKRGKIYTDNIRTIANGTIYYHNFNKVIEWKKGNAFSYTIEIISEDAPLFISRSAYDPWLFSLLDGVVFKKVINGWSKYENQKLSALLKGRKINNVVETENGIFWICTHSGVIHFNKFSGEAELLYPKFAFSDCILDREGNYWLSTLQNGIIRIPQFEVKMWNTQSGAFVNDLFSHICLDGNSVYFAGSSGMIGELNINSNVLFTNEHLPKSDIGMCYYDPIDECVYFNKMNQIYRFKNKEITLINTNARPIKSIKHSSDGYFFLSSQGAYFTKKIDVPLDLSNQLSPEWFREIELSPFSKSIFMASNTGLFEFEFLRNKWVKKKIHLNGKQIISISTCKQTKLIYLLTFDGTIYSIDKKGKPKLFMKLNNGVRPVQLRMHNGKMYLASNKGILSINTKNKKFVFFNKYRGLTSNNVRSLAFLNNSCWVATGKGIQQIPLEIFEQSAKKSRICFRTFKVNGQPIDLKGTIALNYNDKVSLIADGFSYRSNGNFQFAYKVNGDKTDWIVVPGSVGEIKIPSLPTGLITMKLKLIDHDGIDSENVLLFKIDVRSPFWQRWWFYALIVLSVGGISSFFFKQRIHVIRKKQQQDLQRIHLENELRLTQQNALKAQMNPHFLFNVLNSIKGYIYENDKKNAAKYLTDFSVLVRKVLELSSLPVVTLEQEIETLKLYIDLEAMLLQSDFSYNIHLDEQVDASGIKIPALLIQPYVENAFKHGLRHKKGPKKLEISISFLELEKMLWIKITDNGIGRNAAESINKNMNKEHQSFASEAMERRLNLLNYQKEGVVGIEIVDNFNLEGIPEGTTINIRIHV